MQVFEERLNTLKQHILKLEENVSRNPEDNLLRRFSDRVLRSRSIETDNTREDIQGASDYDYDFPPLTIDENIGSPLYQIIKV